MCHLVKKCDISIISEQTKLKDLMIGAETEFRINVHRR